MRVADKNFGKSSNRETETMADDLPKEQGEISRIINSDPMGMGNRTFIQKSCKAVLIDTNEEI